ncbi:hypothetical protein A3742_32140 [Oleiphilus sp. HI0071]|uniref:hypothetical protein n=2 Tax=Oleiphilus TaxID=141450 RepID=UPI0007C2AE80|nr:MULTISPECIES: hypothetical protein [unclassified Oleiphilus]KZY62155.1 hypothetical protein A3737_15005 [Oleiphilus sp. HI0065]KZY83409.1 hypothetical protein A3742_07410 [Oleiphilus sp. HI0071]KZY91080.1 hypothetical protein A3744_04205 [Oleiphilus sp. HI0073]KZZ42103.1 hypothetical protein A3758_05855 [Oleiphilus sp. HI0118]KZZ60450.1 hypothetical protein A3760_06220 [Oleiphilus sp. HI0122]KZZ81906.1 hypothetical protein A3767_05210 [Oleiphilus sp. HI0133]
MTSSHLDLIDLDTRVRALIEAEDIEGIALIDEEIRSYLGANRQEEMALKPEQLHKLSGIYDNLTAYVSTFRDGLATELRGMKTKQKGIKAYQTSNQSTK